MILYRLIFIADSTHQHPPVQSFTVYQRYKSNVPLRSIVALRGSATYNLTQHLTEFLKPLVGNCQRDVLNSSSFIEEMKDLHLVPNEVLTSFDVLSLFTNASADETYDVLSSADFSKMQFP